MKAWMTISGWAESRIDGAADDFAVSCYGPECHQKKRRFLVELQL